MIRYKEKILNNLLDSYERSSLYKGTSCNDKRIYFNFNPKNIKDYFDETNYTLKEDIDNICEELESLGFITVYKGKGAQNHIIKKVSLNLECIDKIYDYVGRKKKALSEDETLNLLRKHQDRHDILGIFTMDCILKLEQKLSIKKYLDIENLKEINDILIGLEAILNQKEEIFKRILSTKLYSDSKRFEQLESKFIRIIRDFGEDNLLKDLSEYNILDNYTYVYFKGKVMIRFKTSIVDASEFDGGIGISSKDIENISEVIVKGDKVITIENLTTFNNYYDENAVIIYLGGYHNSVRRELLKKVYKSNNIQYYHWGDIDVGGFRIYIHLKEKTGIPFIPFNMDIQVLKKYKNFGRDLTDNDKKALGEMKSNVKYSHFHEVIRYMLKENVKLEQEIISEK